MKIAITGGIGSGKSFALKILKSLGYACISLDDVYNKLCQNESFVLKVCSLTETEPAIAGGKKTLDRAAVSKKVFNDKALLRPFSRRSFCTRDSAYPCLTTIRS